MVLQTCEDAPSDPWLQHPFVLDADLSVCLPLQSPPSFSSLLPPPFLSFSLSLVTLHPPSWAQETPQCFHMGEIMGLLLTL